MRCYRRIIFDLAKSLVDEFSGLLHISAHLRFFQSIEQYIPPHLPPSIACKSCLRTGRFCTRTYILIRRFQSSVAELNDTLQSTSEHSYALSFSCFSILSERCCNQRFHPVRTEQVSISLRCLDRPRPESGHALAYR